ncbi:MAG: signal peptidase II [Kiritimatiellia bacterium]|nr:signal peptidase II [Kiritimatiellia bacterium]
MLALLTALGIVILDQWTKEWVRTAYALGESVQIFAGFLSFTYIRNTGAAWGMLQGQGVWLVLLSITMLLTLTIFRKTFLHDTFSHRISLGLMIGGIVGNLFDRIRIGYVTDFVDVYYRNSHFPAFNVADAAICVGVGIYIFSTTLEDLRARRKASGSASGTP